MLLLTSCFLPYLTLCLWLYSTLLQLPQINCILQFPQINCILHGSFFCVTDKPSQPTSTSKTSLTSGVNGLVTLSSTVTQPSSFTVSMTVTTPSLLAVSSSGSLVGPLLSTATATPPVPMAPQSSLATQSASSQYKLQQQQLEMQLKQQQQQLADAETKRLFANGAPHIVPVNTVSLFRLGSTVWEREGLVLFMWQQPKAGLVYSVSYTYNQCCTKQNQPSASS